MKIKTGIIIAAVLTALCAGGCANGQKESQTGTVALATTTAAATEAATTTEAPETTTEAPAKTEAAQTSDEPTDTTQAEADAPAASDGTVKEKSAVVYRGVTFNIGDKADDVIPNLGDQSKPSYKEKPCIPGAGELEHFTYDGIYITVTQFGLICDIGFNATENPGSDAVTVSGIGLGATPEQCKEALGEPDDDYGFMYIYSDGSFSLSVSFDEDTGNVFMISSTDMDIPL